MILLSMLKAVLAMLSKDKANQSNIECAMAVIDELIKHLESNPLSLPKEVIYDSPRTYIDQELDKDAQTAQEELT